MTEPRITRTGEGHRAEVDGRVYDVKPSLFGSQNGQPTGWVVVAEGESIYTGKRLATLSEVRDWLAANG